ncbi:undecaprenyl-phosphate glucose phosphotransferase [Flavobacterium ardleyense]|uniref:undecaprenyl-phosphate glucose phosphotransferase n=1 Tax=Flavobacterium ardleyense TaxID=2038737 RepID=UPI00298C88DF|nr:undecaprenyl-phosphate glucose phosphotransferase [Flavobacterium ardleyense]
MTTAQIGRYSKYIRPLSIIFDLFVVVLFGLYFLRELNLHFIAFAFYQIVAWLTIAIIIKFYAVYRFTTPVEILRKLSQQMVLFLLVVIAYFPFVDTAFFSGNAVAKYMLATLCVIVTFKFLLFYYLKKYRIMTGSNFRSAIIVGCTPESRQLRQLFDKRVDYGYRFVGYFSDKVQNEDVLGRIDDIKSYVKQNKVDEIYCSLNELSDERLKKLITFSENHGKTIKFIPDSAQLFSKNLVTNYYELFPVLSLRKTALHDPINKIIKRSFDIVFSLLVMVFILSWLIPILAILIKLESKGPIFFKQGRPGLDENEFSCYKFRSMRVNSTTEVEARKDDPRVTRIGRFIRKTSIDETPQFLNVLIGDMSVVGPRPHLWAQNYVYGQKIKKYMIRHYIKPGITGLAQVRGYRGEIETDEDMINRIKFDVFYIENWSLLLDIKIIIQTVINIFKGEEKAY